ncbi:hypothetical protein AA21291_1614 [Swaminathania salitolerans LMG 21291]|nr:hypothetical protein AA21291_1614 [Swaminathania salitolerans LMG 21291]
MVGTRTRAFRDVRHAIAHPEHFSQSLSRCRRRAGGMALQKKDAQCRKTDPYSVNKAGSNNAAKGDHRNRGKPQRDGGKVTDVLMRK